ncbi:hypothetical protein OE88DRAFT_872960 [Heliocybe sulcata]|uniref:Uncharacterized protein n=1 Tax=Heliocybe sulcata TaxID=5364 RepID=A0A5C3MPB8_9AGAM|nr:hypothetical protein OE88DRAFT_872960 [Heliocybe sulcata]
MHPYCDPSLLRSKRYSANRPDRRELLHGLGFGSAGVSDAMHMAYLLVLLEHNQALARFLLLAPFDSLLRTSESTLTFGAFYLSISFCSSLFTYQPGPFTARVADSRPEPNTMYRGPRSHLSRQLMDDASQTRSRDVLSSALATMGW